MNARRTTLAIAVAIAFSAGAFWGLFRDSINDGLVRAVEAAGPRAASSPVKAIQEREIYYPGTEDLAPDEMRVTACGTGMPNARPKQAAACWLVELGNGDKFLFDIGTGSAERIAAMKIPYNYLNKVFIGHLHSDHFGDLDALYCGGIVANRVVPLEVWGPSSSDPKYGTKAAMDAFEKMLAWDIDTRMGGRLREDVGLGHRHQNGQHRRPRSLSQGHRVRLHRRQ
jgi:ribonuclease Z